MNAQTAEIVSIEMPKLDESTPAVVDLARSLTVTDERTLAEAHEILKQIKALESNVEGEFAGPTKAAHEAHKKLTGWRGRILKPLQEAASTIRSKMTAYQNELERQRREEARRAEEALQREREAQAQAEAERLEKLGRKDEAEAVIEEAIAAPAPMVQPVIPKREGGPVFSTIWKARITDENAFYRALAKKPELRVFAPISDSMLNRQASAFKGASPIPGVEFYSEKSARA